MGCGSSDDNVEVIDSTQLPVSLELRNASFDIKSNFMRGEDIEFILEIRNNTEESMTMVFDCSTTFDLFILNAENTEMWRWSDDNPNCDLVLTSIVLDPGETYSISEKWDQRISSAGDILSVGNYKAIGSFLDQSTNVETAFVVF